jgi:hypothetical protein
MATNRPASLMLRSLYFQPSPTRPKLPAGTERTGVALKRMALEIGMGADPTKAGVRELRGSHNVAHALGLNHEFHAG